MKLWTRFRLRTALFITLLFGLTHEHFGVPRSELAFAISYLSMSTITLIGVIVGCYIWNRTGVEIRSTASLTNKKFKTATIRNLAITLFLLSYGFTALSISWLFISVSILCDECARRAGPIRRNSDAIENIVF